MKKVAYYINESLFLREKNSVQLGIEKLNKVLEGLKNQGITINQEELIFLFGNNGRISLERLQSIVDLQFLAATPAIAALNLGMEKNKMLLDFPDVKTWELDLLNGVWLIANPASFAIDGMEATLTKNWEVTLKNQCSFFAESEKELQRLDIILKIQPLMQQFSKLSDEKFDWNFSLFEQEYDGTVHIRPDAIVYGGEPSARFIFQSTPIEKPTVAAVKKLDWNKIFKGRF